MGVTRGRRPLVGLLVALVLCVPIRAAAMDVTDDTRAQVVCTLTDPRLTEISGMAASLMHVGVVWVHNDSSGGPRLYAIRLSSCEVVATLQVRGAQARDFEAMASGRDVEGRATLWVADIGDNQDSWSSVAVHAIREPARLRDATVPARTLRFTYPDMPHNAETLLAGAGGRLWVVTKQLANGSFYELPTQWTTGVVVARRVGSAGPLVTDGAMAPDGSRFVLRDYVDVRLFQGTPPGSVLAKAELPAQVQGEAITWSADGASLLVASEADPRILRVPVPEPSPSVAVHSPSVSTGSPLASDASARPTPVSASSSETPWTVMVVVGLVLVALAITDVVRRRSRRGPRGRSRRGP